MIVLNHGPFQWKSSRQTVIALISAEAEYVALYTSVKQITWIWKMLCEIAHQEVWNDSFVVCSTPVYMDSTTAISLASQEQFSARNKHIEIKMHHVRNLI